MSNVDEDDDEVVESEPAATGIAVVTGSVQEPSPAASDPDLRPESIETGQWYWTTTKSRGRKAETWLGCVTHIGSNYAEITEPSRPSGGKCHVRLHFDIFVKHTVYVPNADEIIDGYTRHHKSRLDALMGRMREVTARLAIAPQRELHASGGDAQALSTSLSGKSYGDYKADLVRANKEELPAIFDAIKAEHEQLAKWMSAPLLPLKAQSGALKVVTEQLQARIFNVELYAGLVEEIVQIRDGDPAELGTPLTMIQRRHYMDEECLARYKTGGMQLGDIEDFDAWIARPENCSRLLPFDRCIVAFRVRRYDIKRECHGLVDYLTLWQEHQQDRRTYLYIRNGQRLYRLSTGIDFGEKLFPDMERSKFDGQKLWAIMDHCGNNVKEIITDADHSERRKADAEAREVERRANYDAATTEDEKRKYYFPVHFHEWEVDYQPFDKSSVHFDDIAKFVQDQIAAHNRIALIVQGLLDRSPVLHPHPAWQIWTQDGYEQALRLVYDSDRALTPGAAPDFEAYRTKLNASLCAGSVTVGQRTAWKEKRAEDKDEGRRVSWRDDGPERIAIVKNYFPRKKACRYEWKRPREKGEWVPDPEKPGYQKFIYPDVTCHLDVAAECLLNVSAYVPGDFKQFFSDPRTRAEYIQWAPYLLAAEEWHAGNADGKPKKKSGDD